MIFSEFIRLYPLRAKNITWFFGAGTSVSAGLPTAGDLVWEFKRRIYCSEEGYHITLFNNLSDPAIRNQIQSYFDGKGNYPVKDSVEEYSFYFELSYPSAKDRSSYLMQKLNSIQNSFGHKVIGVLMKNDYIRLIFTTNFDKAFENAAVDQLKTMDRFFVATTDNTQTSLQKYHSNLRPFITKLHGDYFSEKLKNTSDELKAQDTQLRDILYHSCLSNGLAVMGYSGRDKSVMEILNKTLDHTSSFPSGIFWFIRSGSKPLAEVNLFLEKARNKGIQAVVIEIETFDTAWADIIKGIPDLPSDDLAKLNINYFKRTNITLPNKGTKYPVIRFNSVRVQSLPSNARLIKCDAGNTKEITELIKSQNASLIAIRKKNGIVGFGDDSEFEKVFSTYGILEKDVFQIPDQVLNYDDSNIKGLITEGLLKSIVRNKPLSFIKRKGKYLIIPDPKKINDKIFDEIKNEFKQQINGKIPATRIHWIISVEISLQKKFSNYFMLLNPAILATKTDNETERKQIAPFIKEAMAQWYNSKYDKLLDLWLDIIFSGNKEVELFAFDETIKGFNAQYKIKRTSPFTKFI